MSREVSNRSAYRSLFEDWELAVARALVGEFCGPGKTFPPDEFDDLLQDVLAHWFFARDTHDPAKGASLPTYMRRVVRRKLIDLTDARTAAKRTPPGPVTSLDAPVAEDSSRTLGETVEAPDATAIVELRMDLCVAKAKLSDREKVILDLKIRGLDHAQIGKRLGVSRDTVQSDLRRIREVFENLGLRGYLE